MVEWLIKAGIFKERKSCRGRVTEFWICRAKKKLVRRGNEALMGEKRQSKVLSLSKMCTKPTTWSQSEIEADV